MFQGLFGSRTILRIHFQHPCYQVSALVRGMRQEFLHMRQVTYYVLSQKSFWGITLKQISSSKQIKEDRAQTKDVSLIAVSPSRKYFRCYISRRAAFVFYQLILWCQHSKSKVSYPDFMRRIIFYRFYEYVFKLDVSMYDFLNHQEIKSQKNLFHYDSYFGLIQKGLFLKRGH